jgi:hypothetical protein
MELPRHTSTRLSSGAGSVPASRSGPDLASIEAHKDGFTGTLRTLTLNIKVKFIQNC